ncbi:hypothetical protein [Geofilum rubicundum]|uniref:DUF4350 domain-containing protein n=1 Tax=Geofilum rubicundum JCM 15548 TaxID=1236989 RepID=A0A0E9LQS0_9BACT|nr:hypothetical protein [Geofilum rubicundum]GAO27917.1 hypothetical protein JCM15548_14795 [Geofilum rubicundum JCM 15548]
MNKKSIEKQNLQYLLKAKYIIIGVIIIIGCDNDRMIDKSFQPNVKNPMYDLGQGPEILIDESHNNYHTKDGFYSPLSKLLIDDGYVVKSIKKFTKENLEKAEILIISNALPKNHKKNENAFSENDIDLIENWVKNGGSLFLIADHMPCPIAAEKLAKAFNIDFINCYALDTTSHEYEIFTKSDSTLIENIITQGRNIEERIDTVVTFRGQAFNIPDNAIPILKFRSEYMLVIPERPMQFDENTKYIPVRNEVQGAIMNYYQGRLAVFGEAAMFTSQVDEEKGIIGFGYPKAKQNAQFTLNIIHWLDGKLK